MAGNGFERPVLPARRVVVAALAGALGSGALLGLVLGILVPWTPDEGRVVNAAAAGAATTSAAAPTTQRAASSPSASPSKSKSKAVRTVTRSPAAVPDQFNQRPEADRSLTLTVLQGMDAGNRDRVVLYVVRARIISGNDAQQFYQSQGQQPRNTAVVPVDGAQPVGIALRRDAALWGLFLLGDHQNVNPNRLGFDDFIRVAFDGLNRNEHPALWIKREYGSLGNAVYVAEHVAQ